MRGISRSRTGSRAWRGSRAFRQGAGRIALGWARGLALCGLLGCLAAAFWASAAFATAGAARLTVHVLGEPTVLSSADDGECEHGPRGIEQVEGNEELSCDVVQVTVTDSGSVAAGGGVVVRDVLPAGLSVPTTGVGGASTLRVGLYLARDPRDSFLAGKEGEKSPGLPLNSEELCKLVGQTVSCAFPAEVNGEPAVFKPDYRLEMDVYVLVAPGAAPAPNLVSVFEEGVVVASSDGDDPVGGAAPGFGPSGLLGEVTAADGVADTQAGDHPYEFTTRIDMDTRMELNPESVVLEPTAVGELRDVVVDLPLGMVGDAESTPKCTFGQLQSFPASCPADTEVGHITTEPEQLAAANEPVYNMVPREGVAAEFGFRDLLFHTHVITASLAPTPGGYVLQAVSREVPDIALADVVSPFYGEPAEKNGGGATPVPMFTNPADCDGEPLTSKVYLDSWEEPGSFNTNGTPNVEGPGSSGWAEAEYSAPPVTGCNALRFSAEAFNVAPDTTTADSPTGLTVDLGVSQSEQPGTLATPPLRDTTVTLPAGLVPNPASANGLVGCSEAQIGWLGNTPAASTELSDFSAGAPECPEASRIGSVEVTTPLLEKPVEGSLYLASQDANPLGSVLAAYIVIDDKRTGTIVKIAGKMTLDPNTGQVTGSFTEAPQLPFSLLKLRFFGGTKGLLATPETCGTYTTTGLLTPWSAPASGPPAGVSSSFQVNSGCAPGFAPAFTAGTVNPQADGYSPFTLSFSRQDSEQQISGLSVTLPPGLTAKIAGVGKCSEAQLDAAAANPSGAAEAASPSCPASSELGSVVAGSGVGGEPLFTGGHAYLTGPYKGAPLGLAVIVPAIAGPFDLGNVVVRSALYIDPATSQVTAVSDPFPTIIDTTGTDGVTDGFPIRMRSITITLNRGGYILNPTSCTPTSINATFTSTSGATSTSSSRFQASGCQLLPFKPTFQVSTLGHATKANGASLHVHITSGLGQANIAKVHTELPKQLPSWLPTLQKACLAKTFEENPAACPEGSVVGTATATTPLIATPFTGPAYLVSHGGAAFPDLELVLMSEDIKLILDGKTDIKHGITISNFETVPDQPVTSFELNLPVGKNHLLATDIPEKLNHNLCNQKLNMPTLITAQNGNTIKQTTHITTTGCTKPKKHKTTHKKTKHNTKKKKHK
jgi:hypothetical protein